MFQQEDALYPWSHVFPLPAPLDSRSTNEGMSYLVDRSFMQALQEQLRLKRKWFPLIDMFVVDNQQRQHRWFAHQSRFEAVYCFFIPQFKHKFWVVTPQDDQNFFVSLAEYADEFMWPELEAHEFFNVEFGRHPRPRLFLPEFIDAPLLKKDTELKQSRQHDEVELAQALQFEPLLRTGEDVHAVRSTRTLWPQVPFYTAPFRLGLDLINDRIAQTKLEVGLQHRGFEKIAEDLPFQSTTAYTQRLNYLSPASSAIAWCMSMEQAMVLEIPDKAKAMRMVYLELDRMREHCAYLTKLFSCTPFSECQQLAYSGWQGLSDINAMSEGQTVFCNNIAVGGVLREFPMGFSSMCQDVLKRLASKMLIIKTMICRNPQWMELAKHATLNTKDIVRWFVTGPNARASGINLDWRRDNPYYFYTDVEFEIPMGASGDIYDRCLVRVEEILQSIHIMFQILDNLPAGPVMVLDQQFNYELLKQVDVESLQQRKAAIIPKGMWGQTIEAPNGLLRATVIGDGTPRPYRVRWQGPSYTLLPLLQRLLPGHPHQNAEMIVASFGPLASEVDR